MFIMHVYYQLHRLRRLAHALQLHHVVLGERVERLDRAVQHRHRHRQVRVALVLDRLEPTNRVMLLMCYSCVTHVLLMCY